MMFQQRRERLKDLPFNRMIPNILTMLALCAGLTAMRFALEGKWEAAVGALVVAGILDTLDGRIARILQGTSKFGAELDSLSDFVSFGIAPALVLYLWVMRDAGQVGWVLVLLFGVCCALRLARFNTNVEDPDPPAWARNFFTGVPSPGGGGLVLLPMILSFQVGEEYLRDPWVAGTVIVVVSFLLVSRYPTYTFKNLRVAHRYVLLTLLGVGLFAAFSVAAPWTVLTGVLVAYLITLPFSLRSYRRIKNTPEAEDTSAEDGAPGGTPGDTPEDVPEQTSVE